MRKRSILIILALVLAGCGDGAVSDEAADSDGLPVSTSAEVRDDPDTTATDEGSDGSDSSGSESDAEGGASDGLEIPVENSCQLADAEMVQEAFGGTVADGVEGSGYACEFAITGGPVENVRVNEAGPSSSFEGVRSGYHDNFDGSTDVPGIGDEAFYTNLMGPLLLVVSASGQVFVVDAHSSFSEAAPGTEEMVADLARAIVARLEG